MNSDHYLYKQDFRLEGIWGNGCFERRSARITVRTERKMDTQAIRKRMQAVGQRNTKPEMIVRRLLFALGFRYQLYKTDLPGKPDIVISKIKTVIFVHGCFWHRHEGCKKASTPSSNVIYWQKKFKYNIDHDKQVREKLLKLGWNVVTIWECETKNCDKLGKNLLLLIGTNYQEKR